MDILRELSIYPDHMHQIEGFGNLDGIYDIVKVIEETNTH